MSAPIIKINIRGDLLAKLPRLTSQAAMASELKRTMDEQDQITVGHTMTRYLSFPASGPTTPEGLRAITNRLRGNLRAVPAAITPGGGVVGGVSNNVFYARYHELGATIPPHDIVARNKKALRFFGKNGAAVFCKKVHHPGATLPARAPMQRGIKDRLVNYVDAFESAIQRLAALLILGLLLAAWPAAAADVRLVWNPSPSPAITNYFIYFGTNGPGNYLERLPVGTNCTVTLSNMAPAQYWFAATAQATNGAESPFSNEATWMIPPPPANLTLIVLQYGTVVTAITNDVGFFRLKIQ